MLSEITDSDIAEAIVRSKIKAREKVEALGMIELLKENQRWDDIPTVTESDIFGDSDDSEDEYCHKSNECTTTMLVQEVCEDNPVDIGNDIKALADCLISPDLEHKLKKLQHSLPESNSLPTYIPINLCPGSPSTVPDTYSPSAAEPCAKKLKESAFSMKPFLQVFVNKVPIFIRKTTAVWLFQEGERVSSDRLFRVRNKQPFSSDSVTPQKNYFQDSPEPFVAQVLNLGDMCVFETDNKWSIGKVLQFAKLNQKNQQYTNSSR